MSEQVSRRSFLKAIGLVVSGLSISSPVISESNTKRPNFIIMIADDQGWGDAGCYGHPTIKTPNLDILATEGMKFTNAFLTCASCSPTRCSIMTGRYPHSTGAKELHMPLPAEQVVFAGLLKDAGYYTAAAGKWHLGESCKSNFNKIYGGGPSGCENWIKALRERTADKPFFMWLAAFDPHRGYQPNTIPQPHEPEDMVIPPFLPDGPETRKDLALYCDEIARLDSFVGKVIKEVQRQGIENDTFILYLSDNGRPFPRCKTTVYDSGVRTPFIIKWDGTVKASSVCQSLVSVIDIAPTIIELAGLPESPTFQGISFTELLKNPGGKTRDYVYAEHNWHDYQAHERSVRSKEYLYIKNSFPHLPGTPPADAVRSPTFIEMHKLKDQGRLTKDQYGCYITPRPAEELYDVVKDPYSLNNLADDPKYASVLEKMRNLHEKWIKETADWVDENPTRDKFDRVTGIRLK